MNKGLDKVLEENDKSFSIYTKMTYGTGTADIDVQWGYGTATLVEFMLYPIYQ